MSELRQFHPSLRVSKVQELKNNRFLVIGDTPRDVPIICGKSHHHKGCPNREKKQPKCANCKGLHVASYKGCPAYKKQAFRQHVVDNQKSYGAILCQNKALPQPQDKTFTFSAQQLMKFVANVAIQVAQPQVCYINSPPPPQDAIDKKSSMCRRVSEAAKTHLGVDIAESSLFDAIGHLRPPAPSASKPKTFLTKSEALQIHFSHQSHQTICHP